MPTLTLDRTPCTCSPHVQCQACLEWGEPPRRLPLHPRYSTIATTKLAHHLRIWRQKNHLSQAAVAAQIGCSVRAIKDLEAGRTRLPRRWMRDALSAVLGVDIAETTHH